MTGNLTTNGMFAPLTGVALITGAASGIGAATVKSFSRAGVRRFALIDMQAEALKAQAASLGEGHDVITLVVDVSDEAQVQKMVDDTIAKFGRLDYAANCAGIPGDRGSNSEYDFEAFNKVLQINMGGVFLCMRAQLKAMAKQDLVDGPENPLRRQRGSIVNIASMAGFHGIPQSPAYTASKHAVVGLAKSAAGEFAKQSIRINNVAPGWIVTPMTEGIAEGYGLKSLDDMPMVPAGRAGRPEEIADVIVFLSSENASFVNGVTWQIAGGMYC